MSQPWMVGVTLVPKLALTLVPKLPLGNEPVFEALLRNEHTSTGRTPRNQHDLKKRNIHQGPVVEREAELRRRTFPSGSLGTRKTPPW